MELSSQEQGHAPEAVVNPLVLDPQGQEAPEALEEVLQVIKARARPQVREALGVLDQLLSCCVRHLDTIVQVWTGWALLGRW